MKAVAVDRDAMHWSQFYDQRASQLPAVDFMKTLGYHPADGGSYEELFETLLAQIGDKLQLQREHRFLDLACGYGVFTRRLAEHAGLSVGTDLTRPLIVQGRGLIQGSDAVAGWTQANAVAQPFDDQQFDRILCFSMFFHLNRESARRVVGEILRLLRPGGRALIGDVVHPARIHYERSYVGRVPRPLHFLLRQGLRARAAVDGWRGRVHYHAYSPRFFERLAPEGARCQVYEGVRDGRANNASRYDIAIQLAD